MLHQIAIVGPTGYAGYFLLDRLLRHPDVEPVYLASRRDGETDITVEFPRLLGRIDPNVAICKPIDVDAMADAVDVAFLALPHRAAMAYAPALLDAGVKVIDLSADYRLSDPEQYERIYEHEHTDREHLSEAVYGLPELMRPKIADASLIANPGCYPTAAALAIGPLITHSLVQVSPIIINAASGVTGAGRTAHASLHFPEQNESFYAYGTIGGHRHQSEIEQALSRVAGKPVTTLFIPHLLPIDQGILETIYLDPVDDDVTDEDLLDAYQDAYANEPFVRVLADLPNVKHVRDTNFCDIAARLIREPGRPTKIVVFSAIDNMIKGAAGQAIQNMNLMLGLDETAGLL